jgi:hypothetical protein
MTRTYLKINKIKKEQMLLTSICFVLGLCWFKYVNAEGYYCPYGDLGATIENQLLYDYYDRTGNYWTRTGETGWESVAQYCAAKGDYSKHWDAGEWKCNDSKGMCSWDGSSCNVVTTRLPDCKELCRAILRNEGPDCLGDCPGGKQSNSLYSLYCEPVITHRTSRKQCIPK